MPELHTTSKLNGLECWNADALVEECAAEGIDTSEWIGKPNSYRTTNGATPASGYVLLTREQVDTFSASGSTPFLTLEFIEEQFIVTLPSVVFVRALNLTSGAPSDDPKAAYLVELSDKRWLARYSNVSAAYNVLPGDGFVPGTILGDWVGYIQSMWEAIGILGDFPDLPEDVEFTDGPIHRILPNVNALLALEATLNILGCTLVYNPVLDEFGIGEFGNQDDIDDLNNAIAAWDNIRPPLVHRAPIENAGVKSPALLRVVFPSRDWTYSNLSPLYPTTQDEWQLKSTHSELVAGGGAFGELPIYDDMPAVFNSDGTLANQGQLSVRAQERGNAYRKASSLNLMHRIYSGLCNGDFKTSGALSALAYFDIGHGLKTQIITRPARSVVLPGPGTQWDHETDWSFCGALQIPTEHTGPTDVGRWHTPYQRFAWVKLKESLSDRKCGRAVVLEMKIGGKLVFTTQCPSGGQWKETNTILDNVVDVTNGMHAEGDIVAVWYHYQSELWTVLGGGGGGGGGDSWWSKLFDRIGPRHSHEEIQWGYHDCYGWETVPGGRGGAFNAFDVNCGMHNSQAPLTPVHVRMHGPYFDRDDGKPFYLFDYNHTDETDDERFAFVP